MEYADIHFVYGFCDGNAAAAARDYQLRYPDRRHPERRVFEAVHRRLRETGSFKPRTHVGNGGHNVQDDVVLDAVNDNPSSSTRRIASQTALSQSAMWCVLRENSLHHFHLQLMQGLRPGDRERRLEYCQWLLHIVVDEPDFLNRVLWIDEAGFTRDGVVNLHNLHVWTEENPHPARCSSCQHRFSVNVWAGTVDHHLIGPCVTEYRIGGAQCLNFLQKHLVSEWTIYLSVYVRTCGTSFTAHRPTLHVQCVIGYIIIIRVDEMGVGVQ
jgi:hypothetical protein